MDKITKKELSCQICNKILKEPVHLPCHCTICQAHLTDDSVQDGLITCEPCGDEFVAKNIQIKANKLATLHLNAEHHLSDEEKMLKNDIDNLIAEFQQLYDQLKREKTQLGINCHEHFVEIRRQIDIHREELKEKIDQIALEMIEKTKEQEEVFKQKLNEAQCGNEFNVGNERERLEEEFRNLNLDLEHVTLLKQSQEANVSSLKTKLDDLKFIDGCMKECGFESNKEVFKSTFGNLNLSNWRRYLVSGSKDNTVKVWHLESGQCVRTLVGHTGPVKALGLLPNYHVVSGSYDKSIRIWDVVKGVCVQELTGHAQLISCLKVLPENRIATASHIIKVWDLEKGECTQTLEGHSDWVVCLLVLPDETLVSGSQDNTIKLWTLTSSICFKTLTGHTDHVYSLCLLRDGRLASGSQDQTIKIWNAESGDCLKTLSHCHTDAIWSLDSTDKYDLISCSSDKTIKIWNVPQGDLDSTLIRTLSGHNAQVLCIKALNNDTLISSSFKEIKIWDLRTGECTKTLDEHTDKINDLCFI